LAKMGAVKLGSSWREIVPALVRTLLGVSFSAVDEVLGANGIAFPKAREAVLLLRYGFSLFAWPAGSLAQAPFGQPRLLPRMLFRRGPTASLWLIWPEDGCASIA
jgi:hypothetical protein